MPPTQPIPYLNDDDQNWLKPYALPTLADPNAPPPIASPAELGKMGDDSNSPLKLFAQPQLPATETFGQAERGKQRDYDEGQLKKLDTPYDYGQHGFLRNLGHVAAGIGNVAGTILDPSATAAIPHSWLNNQQKRQNLNEDLAGLNTADQTDLKDFNANDQSKALTEYTKQRPDIAYAGMDTKRGIADDKLTGQYGLKRDPTGALVEDQTSQAYKSRVALEQLHQATADKDNINAEIAQNHYVQGTPEYDEAQRKLAQVDQRLGVAIAGLGIKRENLQLRKDNQAALNTGIDPETGKPYVGAGEIADDDGNLHTVGSRFAGHAITSQSNAAQFNDVHGAIDTLEGAAKALVDKGGSLNSPAIAFALSQPATTPSKFIQSLDKAGLTPEERAYVIANAGAHENIQALRKSAGGTATDSAVEKLDQLIPGASTPDIDYLLGQTGQIRATAERLGKGATTAAGGLKVRGQQGGANPPVPSPTSGLGVTLTSAMALPQNKGKSEDEVVKDIEAHGHKVIR
jgi:hypothetical protein